MLPMQPPNRETVPLAQPPALIYAAALTCGVLASLALQLYLRGAGFDLASLWQNMFDTGTRQLRTTGPWWAIAGLAFGREAKDPLALIVATLTVHLAFA